MIINNTITAVTPPALLIWEPKGRFQATLLTALLLTTLSYQAAAIIHNLLLGIKPQNKATANHIHNLLLSDESSPLSIIAAVTRNHTLDALRHHLPYRTIFTRTSSRITPAQLILLFLLPITAPIVNVITVVLAIESDQNLSFASSNVLLALGVGDTTIDRSSYVGGTCFRLRDDFSGDVTAQFFFCSESASYRPLFGNYDQPSRIKATVGLQGDLTVEIYITGANVSAILNQHADVSIHTRTYRLAHAIDRQSINKFSDIIAKRVEEACDGPDIVTLSRNGTLRQIDASRVPLIEVERLINCTTVQPDGRVGTSMIGAAGRAIRDMITLVDVPQMLLLDASDIRRNVSIPPPWVVGNDLPVMTSHAQIAPVLCIAVALGVVLIIRVIVKSLTNNDIADGLEAIVLSRLGFRNGYHLLRSEDTIRYDLMLRHGEQLHYGVPRPGWVEVGNFDRPVGVLWQDEERFPKMKLNSALDGEDSNSDTLEAEDNTNTDTQDSS